MRDILDTATLGIVILALLFSIDILAATNDVVIFCNYHLYQSPEVRSSLDTFIQDLESGTGSDVYNVLTYDPGRFEYLTNIDTLSGSEFRVILTDPDKFEDYFHRPCSLRTYLKGIYDSSGVDLVGAI